MTDASPRRAARIPSGTRVEFDSETKRVAITIGTIIGKPHTYQRERVTEYEVLLGDGTIVRVDQRDLRVSPHIEGLA